MSEKNKHAFFFIWAQFYYLTSDLYHVVWSRRSVHGLRFIAVLTSLISTLEPFGSHVRNNNNNNNEYYYIIIIEISIARQLCWAQRVQNRRGYVNSKNRDYKIKRGEGGGSGAQGTA